MSFQNKYTDIRSFIEIYKSFSIYHTVSFIVTFSDLYEQRKTTLARNDKAERSDLNEIALHTYKMQSCGKNMKRFKEYQ